MYSTNQLEVLKAAQSAAIMDADRLLIGDTEGLYMLDMSEEGLYKFGDRDVRKVAQISMIEEEGLIVLLAGECVRVCVWCVCVCVCVRVCVCGVFVYV